MGVRTWVSRFRARRGAYRALAIVCGILACLLAATLWSCSRKDLGLVEMAIYGVVDRFRIRDGSAASCTDGSGWSEGCAQGSLDAEEPAEDVAGSVPPR